MKTRISSVCLVAILLLTGQALFAGGPGFDDIYQTGIGGQQYQSTTVVPIDQLNNKYGWSDQGAWQGSPAQYMDYGQNGQVGQWTNNGQWSDQGQWTNNGQWLSNSQYSDYGYQPTAGQNTYGVSQSTNYGTDALAQMGQQDFYNDESRSWLPTFGEFFRLTPEQRSDYYKKIQEYRKRLAEDLKTRNRREQESLKDYHRQLGYRRKDEDKDFTEAKRQLNEQLKREDERLSSEYKRQRDQLADEERRLRDYYRNNPLQELVGREKLRLAKTQLEMQYNLSREQRKNQKIEQEAALEARRLEIIKRREQEDQQLKIQQIAWEARYRMAMLSLQGPIFRNKLEPPQFNTGGRIASAKYREYYEMWTKAWVEQRKFEEQRIKELQKANEAIQGVKVRAYKSNASRNLDSAARQQNLRLRLAALAAATKSRATTYQFKLKREQLLAKRRIEDKQLDLYLKELRDAGQRINSSNVNQYREQVKRSRRDEDEALKRQDRDLQEQIKRDAQQHKDYASQLDRQVRDSKEQLSRQFRDMDEQFNRQKRDNNEQMNVWSRRRREEEKYITDQYRRWLEDQKRALAEYERAMRG